MDTRRGRKRTVEAASLNYQVGTRRSRRAHPASHTATTGTPTNDTAIAAFHTASHTATTGTPTNDTAIVAFHTASHTATTGTPTNDAAVAALNTAPPLDIDALVNNISSAIVSQLGNTVRKEVTEHLSNLGIITPQRVSADDINTHGETTNTSHPSLSSVGRSVSAAMGSDVSVTSPVTTASGTITGDQISISIPALSLDIARSGDTQNKPSFTSVALPLHTTVSQKIKEKIWANEFVELSTVFDDDLRLKSNISLHFTETGASVITNQRKRFITIEQWIDAFAKYASVMRIKYPESAEALAQYSATVRSIAQANGNWHYNDTQFRKLRQTTHMPWEVIQHELYFKSLSQKSSFRDRQDFQGTISTSRKVCFKYNRGEHCGGCSFQHACSFCGGTNHAVFRCFKRRRSDPVAGGKQFESGKKQQSNNKLSESSKASIQK